MADEGDLLTGRNREYHEALQASETIMFLMDVAQFSAEGALNYYLDNSDFYSQTAVFDENG